MRGPDHADPLLNEVVTFIQNDVPGFEAGIYRLSITQTLTDASGTINEAPIALDYDFAVTGDRFAFAQPDTTVFAVFPPDMASGDWDTVLPHAVFPVSNLPWIRSPTRSHPEPDGVGDLPTWLWVMMLDEDDAATAGIVLEPATGVVGDLFPITAYAASTIGANLSYFGADGDASDLEPGQAMDMPIQYIDVPTSLFANIAPTLGDLHLMAHVRQVSFVQKPTIAAVTDIGQPIGTFSIIFGNRLPRDGTNSRCYIVSLEGLEDCLPDGAGVKGTPPAVRLAVLHAWRFRSDGQPASFVDQMSALNGGSAVPAADRRTVLQLPYAGDNAALRAGFEMGYVPLDTVMRTGETTVSWYRGPLAPYADTVTPPALPLSSPDAGLIFDPTTGLIDMSYATAWTIGRLMALQDQGFSVPLYLWKQGLQQKLLASVSGEILAQRLAALPPPDLPAHVMARLPEGETASFDSVQAILLHALAGRK